MELGRYVVAIPLKPIVAAPPYVSAEVVFFAGQRSSPYVAGRIAGRAADGEVFDSPNEFLNFLPICGRDGWDARSAEAR